MIEVNRRQVKMAAGILALGLAACTVRPVAASGPRVTQGALMSLGADGQLRGACPQ